MSRNGGIRWHKQWVNVCQTLGESADALDLDFSDYEDAVLHEAARHATMWADPRRA